MKSNSRERRATLGALVCIAASVLALAVLRPPLAARFHKLKVKSDVYALPSPDHAIVASLGWRSAVADMIYAHVLVSYGLHFQEKRRFEFVGEYLDTIIALDPKFRQPYLFADTLLTLQPKPPRPEHYVKARELLERGMQEFPFDAQLWTTAGQFIAYLAPAHLRDPALEKAWQLEGARRLARACELIGTNENLPYHCITAAGILSQLGDREATLQFLERVLAVNDDEEIKKLALGYLERTIGERERELVERHDKRFREAWGRDLSSASKNRLLVVGPRIEAARCAGRRDDTEGCATTWQAWGNKVREIKAP